MLTHRRTAMLARAVLSCALVACGAEQETTLPSKPVESGFILNDNAFAFKNFGGRDPNARVTADSASRMFGVDAVCSNADVAEAEGCRLTPIAKTWMQHVNDSMEGGRCEGFAVLSGLMFLGQMTPQDFGASSVRELELEDNQALAREIAYWFSTQYLVDVIDKATRPVTANEAVKFLAKELAAPTEMYRLGLVRVDDEGRRRGGHAVLPTAVVPGENGTWKIKVYDNNFPDAEREIIVDTAKNRWEYQASSNPNEPLTLYWGSPENGNLMFLSAVTPRLGTHPCLFCAGDETQQAQALAQVFTLGSAEVIAESDGGFAGVLNGRLVNGIVGARIPQMFTNGDNSMMMLVPVGSGVKLRVADGEGERPVEVGVFGPGFSAGFGDSKKVAARADRLSVTADGSDFRFEPSTTTGPSISMARVTKAGTQTVVKLKLPEGLPVTSVAMQVDPETGDAGIQARAEGDVALQVEITRSTSEGEDTFEAEIVAPAEGAVQIEVSEWEGEGAPMPVEVDEEGNGNFEETEVPPTGPVGVAPEAPTGFAGAFEDGSVKLTWNDTSANEESFLIERDAGGGFETLATVAFNSSGASDANVGAGKTYGYRVRAENRYGASAWSEVVWVQIPGCGDGLQDKDGDGVCAPDCSTLSCGSHGACSDASGTAVCECDAGYEGENCERCSLGFQDNDGDGVCARDCATSGVQCGAHGACADASGAAVCVCENGYAGASCGTCAAGWQDNDGDGVCAMTCASAGIDCGDHGACSDAGGAAVCICENGYAGASCGTCAAGWQDNDGDGVCAMTCASSGIDCGDHGACSDAGGAAVCICENGYAGASCGTCAAGWQDNDGDGVCAMTCASAGLDCGDHGACSDAGGAAICACDAGYDGPACESCSLGFQDNDNDGVCAPDCTTTNLDCGANGTCADADGEAFCVCAPGHVGALCDTCDAGYVAGAGGCVLAPARCESGRDCVVELTVPSTLELHQAALDAEGVGLVANTVGFASSGTFTVPDGVTSLTVYALGGGGGGRNDFGGPGGGGGAARSILEVTPGQEITFTVGAGGVGGGNPTRGGDTVVTVGAETVIGGGGRTPGLTPNPSSGQVVVAGGVNGAAGANTDGVCSAGSGAYSVDEGLNKHRVGAPGGCFPAGAGGNGAAQYGEVVTDMFGGIGYLKQPGGHGHTYGGGGGSGGNYDGLGGNGGGGYVQFAWDASPPSYPTDLWAVAAAVGLQHDTAAWFGVARVTPITDATSDEVTFAVSFDGRVSYQVFAGGTWRTIVRAISTDGRPLETNNTRWQLNTGAAGAETFVHCASNTRAGCLQEAFGHDLNRMADLAAVTSEQWAMGFVPGTLDFAVGVRSADPSRSPRVERLEIDIASSTAGLAHCWAGEGNGDDDFGGVDAIVQADITYAPGKNGQAFVCSGQNDINTGAAAGAAPAISNMGPWTYDFWIRVEQANNTWVFDRTVPGSPLVSMHVASNGNTNWLIRFDNGHGINSPAFPLGNTWAHVAVTRGDGVFAFYKDGVLLGTVDDPGFALSADPPKWCGHYGSQDQWMLGQFDTVRIWNRALSPEEIAHSAAGDGSCAAH